MPLYAKMLPPLSFDEVQIHCRVYLKGFYQTYLHLLGPDKNPACSSGASTHVCTATNFTVTQEIYSYSRDWQFCVCCLCFFRARYYINLHI